MEVSFTTTVDDHVAYQLHVLKRSRFIRRQQYLGWLVPPGVFSLLAFLLLFVEPVVAVIALAVSAVWLLLFPFCQRACQRHALRSFIREIQGREKNDHTSLVLTDERLSDQTGVVQILVRWQDMKGVEVVGDNTYIHLTGTLGILIPRRGFERAEDYEAVRDFAVAKLGKPSPGGGMSG
ncbi:MAG: YcxB family protein [Gemmataceae bacterium]